MTAQLYATNDGMKKCLLPSLNITWLGLYKTPTVLGKGFDPTTLVEADFSGYARINIYAIGWSLPALNGDGDAQSVTPQVTFRKMGATGNAEVWGLMYINSDNFTVEAAQQFVDAPYRMSVDGDYVRVTPKIVCTTPIFP